MSGRRKQDFQIL